MIEFFLGVYDWLHIPVPIWIQVEGIVGTVRLRIQFIPEPPFVRNVGPIFINSFGAILTSNVAVDVYAYGRSWGRGFRDPHEPEDPELVRSTLDFTLCQDGDCCWGIASRSLVVADSMTYICLLLSRLPSSSRPRV